MKVIEIMKSVFFRKNKTVDSERHKHTERIRLADEKRKKVIDDHKQACSTIFSTRTANRLGQ